MRPFRILVKLEAEICGPDGTIEFVGSIMSTIDLSPCSCPIWLYGFSEDIRWPRPYSFLEKISSLCEPKG